MKNGKFVSSTQILHVHNFNFGYYSLHDWVTLLCFNLYYGKLKIDSKIMNIIIEDEISGY